MQLHSRYNPQGEAERYINSLSLSENIRFLILIEPALGYMIAPLKKKVPGAKVIALHAAEPASVVDSADSQWHPGMGLSAQDFLEREIPDSEAENIRIVEWRPAMAVYGGAYLSLVEEAAEFIKRADANARTVKAFGRRWFKNFFKNLTLIKKVLCPVPFSLPVLVTAAGPGLEEAIPLFRKEYLDGKLFILAVSSSAAALEAQGIIPDMIVSTDGGSWAKFHLYDCFRLKKYPPGMGAGSTHLAAALSAALPSQSETLAILPISDESLWQSLVLKELNIPFIALPQRGTVSAAALDLAFTLTKGEVFIAGMDLAARDICSHARPYSFERFAEEKERRLNPVYSQTFKRSSLIKAGGSYGIYASWFEKQLPAYPKRLHSLGENNPLFRPLKSSGAPAAADACSPEKRELPKAVKTIAADFQTVSPGDLSPRAAAVLENALRAPAGSAKHQAEQSTKLPAALREELTALLFPGESTPPLNELIEVVRSLAKPEGGKADG